MLRIDRQNKTFTRLETPKLADVSITERYDLQEFIYNSPEAFFEEIGQSLFLVKKEVQPSDDVEDRIDLLALDKEGQAVVIELKRGNNKLQMYQAISYAGMVAKWQPDDFLLECQDAERRERLLDFLEVESEEINRHQRIILIAEAFDYSVLVGAEWLNEQFGVDIICCRLSVAKDPTSNSEFFVCSNVFPAPELAQQAIRRSGRRKVSPPKWSDWKAALANVVNAAVVSFYEKELALNRENNLRKRSLRYRIAGKRRWNVSARRHNAYVWQHARFDGDIEFWRGGLHQPDQVKAVMDGRCLSFSLSNDQDFQCFHQAATQGLIASKWTEDVNEEERDGDSEIVLHGSDKQ